MKFKEGDKVRLIKKSTTEDYYGITARMLEQPEILTIRKVTKSLNGHGTLITVKENSYNYHPSWLEKVDEKMYLYELFEHYRNPDNKHNIFRVNADELIGLFGDKIMVFTSSSYQDITDWYSSAGMFKLQVYKVDKDEIYYIIEGQHFGDSKKYSWLCDMDLYKEINIGDVVKVNTVIGNELVRVTDKRISNNKTLDNNKTVTKKVINKVADVWSELSELELYIKFNI